MSSSGSEQPDLFAELAESGDLCDYCKMPILVGDVFGLKFGEHIDCFDLHDETSERQPTLLRHELEP